MKRVPEKNLLAEYMQEKALEGFLGVKQEHNSYEARRAASSVRFYALTDAVPKGEVYMVNDVPVAPDRNFYIFPTPAYIIVNKDDAEEHPELLEGLCPLSEWRPSRE